MATKLYIFDWNGTLQDDLHHIYECGVERIFRQFKLPCPDMDAYRDQVTADFMSSFYWPNGIPKEVTADDLNMIMRQGFKEKGAPPELFPEAKTALHRLAATGQEIAVVSAYDQPKLIEAIHRNSLSGIIGEVRGDVTFKPPVFLEVMKAYGRAAQDTVCIGDTVEDALAADEVGALPVVYPFGFHPMDKLKAARAKAAKMIIVNSLLEVSRIA